MDNIAMTPSMEKGGTLIILPVLNEVDHIEKLVEKIDFELREESYWVCLIDDGSTDGTLKKIGELKERHGERIHLIQQTKTVSGSLRGAALLTGLKWGLQNTDCDVFVEMDGDLSHRPEELKTGISQIRSDGYDVAIASKYQPDSEVTNRPRRRQALSRVCNFVTGFLINYEIEDYSNGYRFYNRQSAQLIADTTIRNSSPIYLSEVLAIWMKAGKKVVEFPSKYIGRNEGLSKLRTIDLVKALGAVLLIALRYHFLGFGNKSGTSSKIKPPINETFLERLPKRAVLAFAILITVLMAQFLFFHPAQGCFDELALNQARTKSSFL